MLVEFKIMSLPQILAPNATSKTHSQRLEIQKKKLTQLERIGIAIPKI